MEFRGADFIKKVQIKQEAEELRHRIEELEAQSMDSYGEKKYENDFDDSYNHTSQDDHLNLQDLAINEQPSKPKIDKKKLAFLIFFLAIVFIFTVILIRFFMNYTNQNDLVEQNKIDEAQIEHKFEQIVSQTKDVKPDSNKSKEANVTITEKTISPQTVVQQNTQPKPETIQTKPQNTTTTTQVAVEKQAVQKEKPKQEMIVTQKVEKKVEKKVEPKPENKQEQNPKQQIVKEIKTEPIQKTTEKKVEQKRDIKDLFGLNQVQTKADQKTVEQTKSTQTQNSKYIQVGSFSQEPDKKLFEKLKKNNYQYQTKEIKKGDTIVTKVIVGPISEANINKELEKIKQNVAPSAFITK